MDSGQGGKSLSAREMTKVIDRETDGVILADAEKAAEDAVLASEVVQKAAIESGIPAEQAQILGRRVMFGGVEEKVSDSESAEAVGAALELSENLNELENPEKFVGGETEKQKQLYGGQDEDAEKIAEAIAVGKEDSLEAEVTKESLEGVAEVVVPRVDKLLHQSAFGLSELLKDYRDWNNLTLGIVGRKIGDRN